MFPLCQPVDVGFFKDCVHQLGHTWMMVKGIVHRRISLQTRLDIARWVDNVMGEVNREGGIIWSAWKKTWYELCI
jgi:hypothetical protein